MARRRHGKRAASQVVLILRAKSDSVPDSGPWVPSHVSTAVSGRKVLWKTERPSKPHYGLGFKPRRGGFPSGAKKEWGLSPKANV
ncbi:hypothetical protein Tco_0811783 [Tanacetum coccineum]